MQRNVLFHTVEEKMMVFKEVSFTQGTGFADQF